MDIRSFQKLVVETVEAPLYAYLQEEPECGFSKRDIKKCKNLMFSYLGKLKKITAVTDEKNLKASQENGACPEQTERAHRLLSVGNG